MSRPSSLCCGRALVGQVHVSMKKQTKTETPESLFACREDRVRGRREFVRREGGGRVGAGQSHDGHVGQFWPEGLHQKSAVHGLRCAS